VFELAVAPVVDGGRGHQPFELAEAPAQVGVDKKPQTVPIKSSSTGAALPVAPGPASPSRYRGARPNWRVTTMSTGWVRVLARKYSCSVL